MIEDEGYFMDRQTQELCDAFIAGRLAPTRSSGPIEAKSSLTQFSVHFFPSGLVIR